MGPDRVVFLEPSVGLLPDLSQIGENPGVEDAVTVAAVESLDELELDAMADTSGGEDGTGKFGAVIDTKTFGTAPDRDQLVEHTDDPLGGQGYINLYPQRFAVVIVDDVEGPEGALVMVLVIEYEPH
jgi:hypothetical protein